MAADGVDGKAISDMKAALEGSGCCVKVIAPHMGKLKVSVGSEVAVDGTIPANPSILFDALFIPGGKESIKALQECGAAAYYGLETYVHCKPIAVTGDGADYLAHLGLITKGMAAGSLPAGVIVSDKQAAVVIRSNLLRIIISSGRWASQRALRRNDHPLYYSI